MRKYGEDIDKMQQDAVRRMQEMQSRGKTGGMTVQHSRQTNNQPEANNEDYQEPQPVKRENRIREAPPHKQGNFLDMLLNDKERSLIVLLLVLLSAEKTDTGLMLALIYLLL